MGIKDQPLIKLLLFVIIILFFGYTVTRSIGLGAQGFDVTSVLNQRAFYIEGIVDLVILISCAVVLLFVKKKYDSYKGSVLLVSQGEMPAWSYWKNWSSLRIFLFFTILFSILGSLAILYNQTTFTAFRFLEHQFTPVSSLIYSSLLIPIAENLGAAAVMAVTFLLLYLLALRYDWNKTSFILMCYFVIPLVNAFYWLTNHLLRYSSSSVSKGVVFVFGYVGGLLTVFTGSFIPFLVLHQDNNFFFDMKRLFSNDYWQYGIYIGIFLLIMFYVYLYHLRAKKKEFQPFVKSS